MEEIWRDIKGYEGCYQVSSFGNVKSLDRFVHHSTSGKTKLKGRVLKKGVSSNGYYHVVLCKDGKTKSKTIHQLVAIGFLEHIPCGHKFIVDHIDDDKLNNNVSNLRIRTHRFNLSRRKGATSKFVGVSWNTLEGKWRSVIRINGNDVFLGSFTDELEASEAYQNKLKEYKTN